LALLKGFEQCLAEQVTEAGTEDLDREEEELAIFLGTTAGDPVLAVGRQSSAWDDAVQVGVMGELLAPGVEDGKEAELGAQRFGVGSDGAECGGRGLKRGCGSPFCLRASGNRPGQVKTTWK
jgi:hypothetical protein